MIEAKTVSSFKKIIIGHKADNIFSGKTAERTDAKLLADLSLRFSS